MGPGGSLEEDDKEEETEGPQARRLNGSRQNQTSKESTDSGDERLHRLFIESKLPTTFWSGAMEGSLVKHNTSSGSEYASKRAYCVLVGYTLFEFDSEAEAKAMLWPRGEADVIGVSAAPANSAALRSSSLTTSARSELTFIYTTNAGERVCAVANSPKECEKWIVALTLGVELLLLAGMPEAAGGAGRRVAHRPPAPETTATHCAASGQQFGYTVARHYCAACGRAFAASHMAPLPLPLPGIGIAHAARVSDACAQAQQLLNASRCRARFLDVAAHASALEDGMLKKYKAQGKDIWLRAVVEVDEPLVGGHDDPRVATSLGLTTPYATEDVEMLVEARKARDILAAKTAYARYAGLVVDAFRDDVAALVNELHHLCDADDPLFFTRGAAEKSERRSLQRAGSADGSTMSAPGGSDDGTVLEAPSTEEPPLSSSQHQHSSPPPSTTSGQPSPPSSSVDHRDEVPEKAEIRSTLSSRARSVAVRDVVAALLNHRVADDDDVPEFSKNRRRSRRSRGLVFWLPQIAHIYYRQLPPRTADGAVRATLVEELLLSASRRSFHFALRLAWTLVAYLEDPRGSSPSRRPHVLRLLIELEAAAANACAAHDDADHLDDYDDDDDSLPEEEIPTKKDSDTDSVELITFPVTFRDRGMSKMRRRNNEDPWTLRADTVANAMMASRGPVSDEPSPFAGAVALELLPRAPAWLALELRRAAVALRAAQDHALEALDVPIPVPFSSFTAAERLEPPDDVLAREMRFVRALCDVAETMRGVDVATRPARLQVELRALPRRTPLGHSPIGPTTSDYQHQIIRLGRVARIPPNEGHVFKTKARAPTLVLLETVDDDVALALEKARLRESQQQEVPVPAEDDTTVEADDDDDDDDVALGAPRISTSSAGEDDRTPLGTVRTHHLSLEEEDEESKDERQPRRSRSSGYLMGLKPQQLRSPTNSSKSSGLVDRKKSQMKALLADKLGDAPSPKGVAFSQPMEPEHDDEGTARRVASMPGILAAAGAADDDDDEDDDSASRAAAKMMSCSASVAQAKPAKSNAVRRAASVNSGLAALPEKSRFTDMSNKGPYDDREDPPVPKGPRKLGTRAEVARALRKRATLNLNADRLADIDKGTAGTSNPPPVVVVDDPPPEGGEERPTSRSSSGIAATAATTHR